MTVKHKYDLPSCSCGKTEVIWNTLIVDCEYELRQHKCAGCGKHFNQMWVQVKPIQLTSDQIKHLIFKQREKANRYWDMAHENEDQDDMLFYQAQLCALATLLLAIQRDEEIPDQNLSYDVTKEVTHE